MANRALKLSAERDRAIYWLLVVLPQVTDEATELGIRKALADAGVPVGSDAADELLARGEPHQRKDDDDDLC